MDIDDEVIPASPEVQKRKRRSTIRREKRKFLSLKKCTSDGALSAKSSDGEGIEPSSGVIVSPSMVQPSTSATHATDQLVDVYAFSGTWGDTGSESRHIEVVDIHINAKLLEQASQVVPNGLKEGARAFFKQCKDKGLGLVPLSELELFRNEEEGYRGERRKLIQTS